MTGYQKYCKNNLPEEYDVCVISIYEYGIIVTPRLNTVYKYACPMTHETAERLINYHLGKHLDLANLIQPIKIMDEPNKQFADRLAYMFGELKMQSKTKTKLPEYLGYVGYTKFNEEGGKLIRCC